MSTSPRRVATWIFAAAATLGFASGCVVGEWKYDAPPAAGSQKDAEDIKARNVLVVSDEQGKAVLLGAITASKTVKLEHVTLAAERADGTFSEPVEVPLSGTVNRDTLLVFDGKDTKFTDTQLLLGRLAKVEFSFDDTRKISVDVPIYSSTHKDFAETFSKVYG